MSELTAKQKAFIEELPKNQWNGTQAAIAAGYSAKSAGVMAHRLLKNPAIAKELDKRTAEIVERTDVEVGEVIAELRKYAFDRGHKATNSERLKALELLGKYKAMFTDRTVTENKGDAEAKTPAELRQEADELEELIRQANIIQMQVNRRRMG